MEKQTFQLSGYRIIEKRAGTHGNSAYIIVPKSWVGKKVGAILLEKPDE
jgi:putative transposon-encoded protein